MTNVLILTGPIASGKSTVRKLFDALSVPVIDADLVVHKAYATPNSPIYNAVLALLGPEVLDEHNHISRQRIRDMINTTEDLTKLASSVSHLVRDSLIDWTATQSAPYVIWEVPLYTKGWYDAATVLSVTTTPERQKELFLTRGKSTLEAFELIKTNQQSTEAYKELSDVVIENVGTLQELEQKVLAAHKQMIGA